MEILEKNLSLIDKMNKSLAGKIRNLGEIRNSYELKANLAGEYNLAINGMLVHSVNGAEAEAQKIFNQLGADSANKIHIIYGLGLGYMPDYYLEHGSGAVVVYEPDIELIRVVLEIVDFEKQLSAKNFFIASDMEELKIAFELFFRYKTTTDVSCIDYYKYNKKAEYMQFMNDYNTLHSIYSFNYRFHTTTAYKFLYMTYCGLLRRLFTPEIDNYKDIFKGKPAIIVSAGPSLAKNIETLKKAKGHALIFCIGAAYKALYENGITPDFVVLIEKLNTLHHYKFPNNKDVTMIIEPFTHYSALFEADFKRYIMSVSYETVSNHWFEKLKNKKPGDFEAKGTVSYQALSAAKLMGCDPLILVGQDLAFVDGKCYAKGSPFEDLECIKDEKTGEYKILPKDYEKFRDVYCAAQKKYYSEETLDEIVNRNLEKLLKGLTLVDGQNGGKLPTQSGYAMFIKYFEEFASKNNGKNQLINASTGGANIKGFKNIPLKDAVMPYMTGETFDAESVLAQVKPELPDMKTLKTNMISEKEQIEKILPMLETGQSYVKIINLEHLRHKKSTQIALNTLKKALELYCDITNNCYNKNILYRLIATEENAGIKWFLRENKDVSDTKVQEEALGLLKNYYFETEKKCKEAIKTLERNIGYINESSVTKS